MLITNRLKALIHVAKGQLHMADEDYRAMLRRAAGVSSSSELDEAGFENVMAEFERLGFRHVRQPGQNVRREGFATPKQLGRMRALWKEYSGADDELALGKWLEKHKRFHVSSIRFVRDADAGKVIAVLGRMAAWRRAKRAQEAAAGGSAKA